VNEFLCSLSLLPLTNQKSQFITELQKLISSGFNNLHQLGGLWQLIDVMGQFFNRCTNFYLKAHKIRTLQWSKTVQGGNQSFKINL